MPFTGYLGDELVCPHQVPSGTRVTCPGCGGEMWLRKEYWRDGNLIPRVFVHKDASDCGGESDDHLKLKSYAVNALEQMIPEASVSLEQGIDGTNRIADVVAEFPIEVVPYGKGIIVEAQVSNKAKNIGKVTRQYLNAGFSVYWCYMGDIEGTQITISEDRLYRVWPDGVPYPEPEERYPDSYAARHMRGRNAPEYREEIVEVSLPPEYYTVHGHDIISPRNDEDWIEMDTVWLRTGGPTVAWCNILYDRTQTGELELVIEFWKKARDENLTENFGNLRVASAEDINKIQKMAHIMASTDFSKPNECISVTLSDSEMVETTLSVSPLIEEEECVSLQITREGRCVSRQFSLEITEEAITGLKELPDALKDTVDKIASAA